MLTKNQLNQQFQELWKNIGHILNGEDAWCPINIKLSAAPFFLN